MQNCAIMRYGPPFSLHKQILFGKGYVVLQVMSNENHFLLWLRSFGNKSIEEPLLSQSQEHDMQCYKVAYGSIVWNFFCMSKFEYGIAM